jgi:predicted Zn-dependent protease
MKLSSYIFLMVVVFVQCNTKQQPVFDAPLLNHIGDYHVSVTTSNPHAKRFFDQGIIMANGFNHAEADRSFREAVKQDSTFAMGYWGIAYVNGSNYNSGGENMGAIEDIQTALKNALRFGENATTWEQAVIQALATKYPIDSIASHNEAYAERLKNAYAQFNSNDFVATLYAESLMNLHAWDFYGKKKGTPRPWTAEIVEVLESAMKINPENPLANHLYIHATEGAPDVEKALTSAQRLKTLVPAAGHLVHMPSHVYINTGDYHEGSLVNEQAVVADSIYIAQCKAQGIYPQYYYPHNYHFLAATATFEGRGAKAIEAAYKTVQILDKKYYREAGYETLLHYATIPLHVLVKFEQWEKILALPKPEDDLSYPLAIWYYARGMAYANTQQWNEAEQSLRTLDSLKNLDAVKNIIIWAINPADQVCNIAAHVLRAEIPLRQGNYSKAIEQLHLALALEDQLNYNEPPDWFFSIRHLLGNAYLLNNDFIKAEHIYREDLVEWPKNGFALNGLYESLLAQNKTEEVNTVKKQLTMAWQYADTELKYSRVDGSKRKDLALNIDDNSPNTIILLAEALCFPKSLKR